MADTVSLREYLEKSLEGLSGELKAQKELTGQRFLSLELAAQELARQLAEYKLQANEWRGQSKDQQQTFITRVEANAKFDGHDKEIRGLRESGKIDEGGQKVAGIDRLQMNWAITLAVGVIGTIVGLFLKSR